jgi:hypothetical protein
MVGWLGPEDSLRISDKNYLHVHRPLAVRGQWQYEIGLECFHV